jgi:hypothetical protein
LSEEAGLALLLALQFLPLALIALLAPTTVLMGLTVTAFVVLMR